MSYTKKLMIAMEKAYVVLDCVRVVVIISVLSFIIGLGTFQIISRYFSNLGLRPYAWGDEVIRLSSLWVSFLGASLATKEKAHLCVAWFTEKYFCTKNKAILKNATNAIITAVFCYLAYLGFLRTLDNIPTSLQNLDISISWFYAAVPVGFFYLIVEHLAIVFREKTSYGKAKVKEIFLKNIH